MKSKTKLIVALATAAVFLGRGYEYTFWGSPIRVLAWDESLFGPVVRLFGGDWTTFATSATVDHTLSMISLGIGVFLMLLSLLSLSERWRQQFPGLLLLGAVVLGLHTLLDTKDHFYHYAQFFEHALRVGTPVLLYMVVKGKDFRLLRWVQMLTALTFAAHGLYAIGFYDVPAHFINMTQVILGVGEGAARTFLWWAGLLDLLLAVALFVPRLRLSAFGYAIIWGGLTTLARIVYGWEWADVPGSLHGHLYQTVVRLPHVLLPILGWMLAKSEQEN